MANAAPGTQLVLSLVELDRSMLSLGGGKAVNLGELIRADLPVPPGVCLTTAAYAQASVETQPLIDRLSEASSANDRERIASDIRASLTR
ncbi:MAG TPA: PEP/pyruvate-binding domain-containing protein, partial [Chloroflexota bacterium]|nr:PEP/pyruvate-binding domain-containing protein [Chloroflexota bacterium]